MEGEDRNLNMEGRCYPILVIPKACTSLETNCDMENLFIQLNMSSPDTEGNETVIYNGLCNVRVVEGNDVNNKYSSPITEENQITFPAYNESEVWIDPSRSPYVYNCCETPPLESYTITEGPNNQIIIEQHNMYITQNVYNYNEAIRYSPVNEEETLDQKVNEPVQNLDDYNKYQEEELECGVFLSQLSEEIKNENETRARDEKKFVGLKTENEALKQLMSTDIQSASSQQKTILFLGNDSASGQTIQNIAMNDPSLRCKGTEESDSEIVDDPPPSKSNPRLKKYQCNKCKQIFDQLAAFKQHMVGNHRFYNPYSTSASIRYNCTDCGKNLKTKEKFAQHCLGHGDPDLECNKCHKVFASKFTLRAHLKLHSRMFPCRHCVKSYSTAPELYSHSAKVHDIYMCEYCTFSSKTLDDLTRHQKEHVQDLVNTASKSSSESDIAEGLFSEVMSDISGPDEVARCEDTVQQADSVIAKVISNELFLSSKNKKQRKYDKTCDVCYKKFDRVGDLKRHLIEHVIRSTLAKNPVNKYGVLNIRCEICQEKVFSKIDRYKAHLREHAKLTLYKCTFCDKSFSDSSNFSKHKKVHGTTFFQCDICQRKFNSKRMISQHMEYHNKNCPLKCQFCDKVFHFKSMLNKHLKSTHVNKNTSKFKCRFCMDYFKSLKEKWDHEWTVHNLRKVIVDCLVCGSQFRKYAELKRHCTEEHDTAIPSAKKLLRWKLKNKMKIIKGK